ncbi:MAG: hypothetical protein CMI53_02205 [Parcubacteria group bacterium]|nr:hypothetical protein [Parcubacteria group bacterium]
MVRDLGELSRVLKALESFAATGHQVITVNRCGRLNLQENLEGSVKELGVEVIEADGAAGIGGQIKQCWLAGIASGADIIIYTEGDKYQVTDELLQLVKVLVQGADAVALARNWRSTFHFPISRWLPETITNILQSVMMRKIGDWQFGPKAFTVEALQKMMPMISQYGRINWQIATWLLVKAVRLGLNVQTLSINVSAMAGEDSNRWPDWKHRLFKQLPQAWQGMWDALW